VQDNVNIDDFLGVILKWNYGQYLSVLIKSNKLHTLLIHRYCILGFGSVSDKFRSRPLLISGHYVESQNQNFVCLSYVSWVYFFYWTTLWRRCMTTASISCCWSCQLLFRNSGRSRGLVWGSKMVSALPQTSYNWGQGPR